MIVCKNCGGHVQITSTLIVGPNTITYTCEQCGASKSTVQHDQHEMDLGPPRRTPRRERPA